MNNTTKSLNFSLFMLCITAFFYHLIGNGYLLLGISLIPIVLTISNSLKSFDKTSQSWMVFIALAIISTAFAFYKSDSYKFILMLIALFLVKLALENSYGWQQTLGRFVFAMTALHVLATFVSLFLPNIIVSLAKSFFSGETLKVYLHLFEAGAYAGITGQTAINAFFISVFIAFTVSNLFNGHKRLLNTMLLVVGIIALFLTQKRSFLVSNSIAAFVLFWRIMLNDKHKFRKVFTFIFLFFLAFLVFSYIPETQQILEKMKALEKLDDITNGRTDLWSLTIKLWRQSPIFGVGTNALVNTYGLSSHNVYLQLMAEMGIVGMIGYVVMILSTLIHSFNTHKLINAETTLTKKEKSLYGTSIYIQILFIVYSFFGNPLYGISFILPYTLFVALIGSYSKYRRGIENENRNTDIS